MCWVSESVVVLVYFYVAFIIEGQVVSEDFAVSLLTAPHISTNCIARKNTARVCLARTSWPEPCAGTGAAWPPSCLSFPLVLPALAEDREQPSRWSRTAGTWLWPPPARWVAAAGAMDDSSRESFPPLAGRGFLRGRGAPGELWGPRPAHLGLCGAEPLLRAVTSSDRQEVKFPAQVALAALPRSAGRYRAGAAHPGIPRAPGHPRARRAPP